MDGAISVRMDRLGIWTHIYVCKFCYFGKATQVEFAFQFQFSHSILRSSCYTDGNGPEVFMQCSTKWIRNFDTSKDEYGDSLMIETVINLFFQTSTRIHSGNMVVKKV